MTPRQLLDGIAVPVASHEQGAVGLVQSPKEIVEQGGELIRILVGQGNTLLQLLQGYGDVLPPPPPLTGAVLNTP